MAACKKIVTGTRPRKNLVQPCAGGGVADLVPGGGLPTLCRGPWAGPHGGPWLKLSPVQFIIAKTTDFVNVCAS